MQVWPNRVNGVRLYTLQGSRIARERSRFASGSLMNSSLIGSYFRLRSRLQLSCIGSYNAAARWLEPPHATKEIATHAFECRGHALRAGENPQR